METRAPSPLALALFEVRGRLALARDCGVYSMYLYVQGRAYLVNGEREAEKRSTYPLLHSPGQAHSAAGKLHAAALPRTCFCE